MKNLFGLLLLILVMASCTSDGDSATKSSDKTAAQKQADKVKKDIGFDPVTRVYKVGSLEGFPGVERPKKSADAQGLFTDMFRLFRKSEIAFDTSRPEKYIGNLDDLIKLWEKNKIQMITNIPETAFSDDCKTLGSGNNSTRNFLISKPLFGKDNKDGKGVIWYYMVTKSDKMNLLKQTNANIGLIQENGAIEELIGKYRNDAYDLVPPSASLKTRCQ